MRWVMAGLVAAGINGALADSADAASAGRVLFYNSSSGQMVAGGVDKSGYFQTTFDGSNPGFKGMDTVIPAASGFILYSYLNGGAQAYLMDGNGSTRPGATRYPFSAHWYNIIPVGNYTVFYDLNGNTNVGAVVASYPDGTLHQTYTNTAFSSWTQIVPTDNYLLFYNSANGLYLTSSIDVDGHLFQNTTAQTTRAGYTNAAAVGDDVLLWNFANGQWESGALNYTGLASGGAYVRAAVSSSTSFKLTGFDLAVESNEHLLIYNSATGAAMTGHFLMPLQVGQGTFVKDKTFTLPKYFTSLLRCGEFLVFYGYGVGQVQVGYMKFDGSYQETQSFPLGAGYSVAASRW